MRVRTVQDCEAQLLGESGFVGAVYNARDRELGRVVALKIIRPELAGQAEIMRRFKQEILLASKITHKNIIRISIFALSESTRYAPPNASTDTDKRRDESHVAAGSRSGKGLPRRWRVRPAVSGIGAQAEFFLLSVVF